MLGLGSNIYPKTKNIAKALKKLSCLCRIEKVSGVYESASLLGDSQPYYYNVAAKIYTNISALDMLDFIKNIEVHMGRKNTYKWGPRNIDIDILDFDNIVLNEDVLNLPHPGFVHRSFTVLPVREIFPEYIHPVSKLGIDKMWKKMENSVRIKRLGVIEWL